MKNKEIEKKNIKINEKFFFKKINNIYNKYIIDNIILFSIFIFFSISSSKLSLARIDKLKTDSEIILAIKGKGNQPILNNQTIRLYDSLLDKYKNYIFNEIPSEVFINGNRTNKIDFYVYNLILEENIITIKFNKTLSNCNVMFYGLSNITKINFIKFDFSGTDMSAMFRGCNNLISLDLSNIDTSSVTSMESMFNGCNKLISLNLSNFDTSSLINIIGLFANCSNLKSIDLSNFDTSSITRSTYCMFDGCINLLSLDLSNFNTKYITKMKYMFRGCSKLISLDLSNFDTKSVTDMKDMFYNCNSNLVYCISNNTSDNLLSSLKSFNLNYNNCSDICFYKNKKIILDTRQCVLNCPDNYKFEYNNICYSACPNGTHNIKNNICEKKINYDNDIDNNIIYNLTSLTNKYIDYFNNIIKNNSNSNYEENIIINLKNELMSHNLDIFIENIIIKAKKDLLINHNNILYQLTSSYNQNENIYNNISNINISECETKLRIYYDINNNVSLIILKRDIFLDGLLIPIIEYEVFNSETKEKLNLTICNNIKININIPVIIDENNIFKYNSSHDYYNNMCYSYKTKNNTDIILKDRQNEYINNYMSLCEKNCEYIKYDFDTKKVLCKCFIKKKFSLIPSQSDIKNVFSYNFKNIRNIFNIKILKCYKEVFNKEGLKKNIGHYIMNEIILFTFIFSILFKIKGYNNLKDIINKIIENKNEIVNKVAKNNPIKKRKKSKINIMITNNDNTNTKLEKSSIIGIIKNKKVNNNRKKNLLNYNDYELNNLSYKEALIVDKRTYYQYYLSLLKIKHILIFTFYTNNDYNSKLIKIILFLFSFSLYFTVNSLFFNNKTLHQIYIDQGKYNFIYQIPIILYSTIIISFIDIIIKYFSLTEKNVIEIKKEKYIGKEKKKDKIFKYLIIKLVIFFILIFVFLILFWYYLTCFCAIYANTQIHLIKDIAISFGLSLLYPFILYLLPGIFRIPSLKKKKECLFKISQLSQITL